MTGYFRQQSQVIQIVLLVGLALVDVAVVAVIILDGSMLYWSNQQAQHAAEAVALAGADALAALVQSDGFVCGTTSDQLVLDRALLYAGLNNIPDPTDGQNVDVFYVVEDDQGNRVDLRADAGGLRVGATGTIPCENLVGLHALVQFPRQTFVTSLTNRTESRLIADAYATLTHQNWCRDYALFALGSDRAGQPTVEIDGANIQVVSGGVHSNGSLDIMGDETSIQLDPAFSVEAVSGISGGISDTSLTSTAPVHLAEDFFYTTQDFAAGGFLWEALPSGQRFVFERDLTVADVMVDGQLQDGLYVVDGDVDLSGLQSGDQPWRVTIAATGKVRIDGAIDQTPLVRSVFVYSAADPVDDEGAVELSGGANVWTGLVIAPAGRVVVTGSDDGSILTGTIVAEGIRLTGSNIRVYHEQAFCPPDRSVARIVN